jgi:hypothetical protein
LSTRIIESNNKNIKLKKEAPILFFIKPKIDGSEFKHALHTNTMEYQIRNTIKGDVYDIVEYRRTYKNKQVSLHVKTWYKWISFTVELTEQEFRKKIHKSSLTRDDFGDLELDDAEEHW